MNRAPGSKPFVDVVAELLSRGYRVRFRAEGASMRPTIRGGETITVEPVSEIRLGDIALYRADRGLIAHRVVGIRNGNGKASVFLTRGEAAGSTKEAVEKEQVLGKVVAVERNGYSIDLVGRWATLSCRARRLARLAGHWAARLSGVHGARRFLLVSVLVAIFPNAVRANLAVRSPVTTSSDTGGSTCTMTGLNTSAANYFVVGVSSTGAGTLADCPLCDELHSAGVGLKFKFVAVRKVLERSFSLKPVWGASSSK